MTGILILVGRTPVCFMSKRQGATETSTYGAEFCAMRTAVEGVTSIRYMLRCHGVKVRHASLEIIKGLYRIVRFQIDYSRRNASQ